MRWCLLLLSGLPMIQADPLAGQGMPVTAGDRVRISTSTLSAEVFTVIGTATDTIFLRPVGDTVVVVLPHASLRRIDVHRPRSKGRGALRGGAMGYVVGMVVGGLIGTAYAEDFGDPPPCVRVPSGGPCEDIIEAVMAGAMIGSASGLAIGAVAGSVWPGRRWERLGAPARIGLTPSGDGRIRVSLRTSL